MLKDNYFIAKATGNEFSTSESEILLTGSMVAWDVIKMKTAESYGMEIDQSFHEAKDEEKITAKR